MLQVDAPLIQNLPSSSASSPNASQFHIYHGEYICQYCF
jgi:hypothetical protein